MKINVVYFTLKYKLTVKDEIEARIITAKKINAHI